MDELYRKFLPQFVSLARSRVESAKAIATAAEHDEDATRNVVRELHTLAGEAGLLGLRDVVPLARECEQRAKELQTSRAGADAEGLVAALRQLEGAIERVATA